MAFVCVSIIVLAVQLVALTVGDYSADWSSLDSRPLPEWFDKAKFGIFIHWGVYSVPSTRSEWFWYYWKTFQTSDVVDFMNDNYPSDFEYQDFAQQFHAELFDPDQWADIFKASGAKYVVLTSKHHEGYTMWPSSYSEGWNSDVGPGKDLVGLLASSVRGRTDLRFGLYYSLLEWYHPLYLKDQQGGFVNREFPETKAMPELRELVETYKPDIVWMDGDWENSETYWGSTEFVAWLYNESPVKDTVVTNDRWGTETRCQHGGFFNCEDNYNPGNLESHKWENAHMLDHRSWGYRRQSRLDDYEDIEEILRSLITTVSNGGNLLLNIGPTADGRILPIFEERLKQIGHWLSVNGEGIYESKPWTHQYDVNNAIDIWYTTNEGSGAVYAFLTNWPEDYTLTLGSPVTTEETVVTLLGYNTLTWTSNGEQGLSINLPYLLPGQLQWAWVIKLENVT